MFRFKLRIATKLGNHSFRATAYLRNGGTLEKAALMANHASTRHPTLTIAAARNASVRAFSRIQRSLFIAISPQTPCLLSRAILTFSVPGGEAVVRSRHEKGPLPVPVRWRKAALTLPAPFSSISGQPLDFQSIAPEPIA